MEAYSNFKILTIDDESYIRQSIRTYLEDYGFTVFEAENGRQGISVFQQENPDLVLLDLRMPEMDGLQVLDILSKKAPDIPMVVASGTGNITAVVQALRLGAWDYILKPIEDMTVLYHSVRKCLKESRLKKENKAYQERLEELVKERTLELEQSEQRYKAIFEYSGTAAIIVEADGTISMANSRFSQLVGMDRRQIEGRKKWTEFVALQDRTAMENHFRSVHAMETEAASPVQYEVQFQNRDGDEKYVYVSLGNMPGTDRQVISLLDVTEKKLAEKRWHSLEKQLRKSQKMEAIGTLAGGIAHDLNNILSPVLGYSDMIMRASEPSGKIFQRSEKIQKAALRAADLVSQVLSFNRGGIEENRKLRLHPLIAEVVKLLRGSIPSTIQIIDRVDRQCGPVFADPTQIHQVLMNLCTNAYHAMEEGGGELTVGLRGVVLDHGQMMEYPNLTLGPGPYLIIEVSDTGMGMTEDVMERIFDPYFTTKEEGKGTGLGLATAYRIVQSYNGDIRVKSAPGRGSTFSVILPAVQADMAVETGDVPVETIEKGSGEKVMVVDDDPDVAAMCKEGFETMGYEPVAFMSSADALDYFKHHHDQVDLVVTDQTMPGKTGFELAKEMMAIRNDLPVILCSGYAGTISKKMIAEAGIKRFIMKPVTVETLSREIQDVLNQA